MATSQFARELRLMGLTDGSGNLIASTSGSLNVYITGGSALGPVGTADKSTFTYGTSLEQTVGGVYQDTAPTLTAGQAGAVRLTQYRGQHTNLRTAGGVELLGAQLSAASLPVVLASDQVAIPVTGTFWQATQPISGTVTVNPLTNSSIVKAQLQDNSGTAVVLVNSALPTQETRAATSTLSNVASSATNVTLLALNANRLGAMIFNDSTQVLYLKFGATSSVTSYTVQLAANGYYELPTAHLYTGIIDGLWASANGNARVTELTA